MSDENDLASGRDRVWPPPPPEPKARQEWARLKDHGKARRRARKRASREARSLRRRHG